MTTLAPFALGPFFRIVAVNFGGDDVLLFRALANNVENLAVSILTTFNATTELAQEYDGTLFQNYAEVEADPELIVPWSSRNGIVTHWGQKLWTAPDEEFFVRWTAIRLPALRAELTPSSAEQPLTAEFSVVRDWVANGGPFLNNSTWQAFTYRAVSNIEYADNGNAEYDVNLTPDEIVDSFASDTGNVDLSGGDPITYHAEESFTLNFETLELT